LKHKNKIIDINIYYEFYWKRKWSVPTLCKQRLGGQIKPESYANFGLNLLGRCLMEVREILSNE